jgi:opacity protein-like surface antigen
MNGIFAVVIAIVAIGGPAKAADALHKTPVKAALVHATARISPPSWTGCYVGGQIGAGWGHEDFSNPAGFELSDGSPLFTPPSPLYASPVMPLNESMSGFLGGGQVGCKFQFALDWVAGVEGDFSGAHLFGYRGFTLEPFVANPATLVPASLQIETDWLASATGNIGYSLGPALLYVKGGIAWSHNKYDLSANPPDFTGLPAADFQASETRTGWTIGGGIEYRFWNSFSAQLEYNFYEFGTKNVLFADQLSPSGSIGQVDVKQQIQAVKLGLNYYFWNAADSTSSSASVPVAAAPATMSWSQAFSSEVRYFSWQSNRGMPTNAINSNSTGLLTSHGSGAELYIPYASQLVGQSNDFKIELLGRGGWVWARQSTAGLTGEVSTATDTTASGTITYLGLQGIQPFISISLNLPTGLAALPPSAVNARMDPDLVDIATFGEGLNVGPTVGFNLPLTSSLMVSASVGYTWRGTFDREGQLTPPGGGVAPSTTSIKPGNALTGTGSIGYQTNRISAKITGTISEETATTENGMPFVKAGMSYLGAGIFSYNWPMQHVGTTTLSVSASHVDRNEVLFQCLMGCPTTLVTEPFNTNSNLYRVGLEHLFVFDQVALGPTASFLYRDRNGYEPTTLQFVPAKRRWAIGAQARYAPNQNLLFNARIDHVWTREDDIPVLPGGGMYSVLAGSNVTAFTVPVVSSTGWQFTVGATATF